MSFAQASPSVLATYGGTNFDALLAELKEMEDMIKLSGLVAVEQGDMLTEQGEQQYKQIRAQGQNQIDSAIGTLVSAGVSLLTVAVSFTGMFKGSSADQMDEANEQLGNIEKWETKVGTMQPCPSIATGAATPAAEEPAAATPTAEEPAAATPAAATPAAEEPTAEEARGSQEQGEANAGENAPENGAATPPPAAPQPAPSSQQPVDANPQNPAPRNPENVPARTAPGKPNFLTLKPDNPNDMETVQTSIQTDGDRDDRLEELQQLRTKIENKISNLQGAIEARRNLILNIGGANGGGLASAAQGGANVAAANQKVNEATATQLATIYGAVVQMLVQAVSTLQATGGNDFQMAQNGIQMLGQLGSMEIGA